MYVSATLGKAKRKHLQQDVVESNKKARFELEEDNEPTEENKRMACHLCKTTKKEQDLVKCM